eukprot:127590_1
MNTCTDEWHSHQHFTKIPRYNKTKVFEILIAMIHLSPSQHLEQILGTIDHQIIKETLKRMKHDVMYQIFTILKNIKTNLCATLPIAFQSNHSLLTLFSITFLLIYLFHFTLPAVPDIYLDVTNASPTRTFECSYFDIASKNASNPPPFPIDIVILYTGDNDRSNHELKYTLRSINAFLPWHHHIYIVAPNTHYPSFINSSSASDSITMIAQDTIFKDASYAVNNHNSLSYEIVMHHIPKLSEHFIYFNDDFLMGRLTPYQYFFNENGTHVRWSKRIVDAYIGDNHDGFVSSYSKWSNYTHKYPVTMGARARGYLEHHPRPLLKSYLFALEARYPEWFALIASHKSRYDSSLVRVEGINSDSVESESLHLHMMAQIASGSGELKVEVVDDSESAFMIHYWAYSKHNLKPRLLRQITEELLCLKPVTFCVNDNFDPNRKSKLYKEQSRIMTHFHQTYYRNVMPQWEKGYSSHKVTKQNTLNVAFNNHKFCAGRKSCMVF